MFFQEQEFQSSVFSSSVMSQSHQGICQVFASGKHCRFGKHCRYLHFRKPPSRYQPDHQNHGILNAESEIPDSISSNCQSCETPVEHGSHRVNPNTKERSNPIQARRSDIRKCRYYNNGFCAKGDNCVFLHDVETPDERSGLTNSTATDTHQYEKETKESKPSAPAKGRAQTCHYFAKGSCRNGKSCRFSHDKTPSTPQRSTESQKPDEKTKHKFTFTPVVIFSHNDLNPEKCNELRGKFTSFKTFFCSALLDVVIV